LHGLIIIIGPVIELTPVEVGNVLGPIDVVARVQGERLLAGHNSHWRYQGKKKGGNYGNVINSH
jgi:hypothetical protein